MADLKISELNALSGANLATSDELAIVDDSASETKKITVETLIANGITLISDDTIPGAKILFGSGDIATAALADSAVTTAKIANDAVTAAKIADETTVDLVTTLPASGAFTGQLALDTDDNKLYAWDGSSWQSLKAPGSVNTVSGSTTGEINIVSTVSGDTVTISATLDNTTAAAQFLAGPVGSAGAVGYRAIDGGDLPTSTTTAKGGVIVNGEGLRMDSDTIEVDNDVTASSVHHVVTYDAKGLITGGRVIASSDLPIATTSARGAVIASSGLAVDASGNLSIDNTVTSGTYTKVTVTAQGVVSAGETLTAADIPDHSAAKLTSGTIGSSLIANDAITAAKLADQSTMKFGGATGTDGVTIFPTGDFQGQLFFDETSEDLYFYSGSAFVPITVISGNLVNAGTYNASTNLLTSVTTLGSGAGFTAGSALPAPSANNLNHYVVVDTSGTGTGAAPGVALAPPDMLLSQGVGTEFALIDVSNAIAGQTASNISVVATGNIVATDVQAALVELDNEKVAKAGDTMTGDLNLGDGVVIVFEGSTANDYETTLTVTDPTADRTITLPNVTGTVVTTGDTGSVTSTMITDGTIVNADINANAEIAVSKLANGTARQLLQTAANGSDVEFTSNVDVPGTLDVTGAATLDSTLTVTGLISADGKVSFPAGTAAAPSLYPGSDTNTGIYSPGSDQLAISTNGTAGVTVDASQQVGIGNTAPDAPLRVTESAVSEAAQTNDIAVFERNDNGYIKIYTPNNKTGGIAFGDPDDGFIGAVAYDHTDNALEFYVNNNERMRIDSSGRLLVGTTSSRGNFYNAASGNDHAVQIEGTSFGSSCASIVRNSNDGNSAHFTIGKTRGTSVGSNTVVQSGDRLARIGFIGADGSDLVDAAYIDCLVDGTPGNNDMPARLVFLTTADGASSPTERMRIKSSGNVGIGQTNPAQLLHLTSTGSNAFLQFSDSGSGGSAAQVRIGSNGNDLVVLNNTGSNTATERMRIDSSGRLLVGTSTARSNFGNGSQAFRMQLEGDSFANAGLSITRNTNDTGTPSITFGKSRSTGNTAVANGDPAGTLFFEGNDGSNFIRCAQIEAKVDGTPGTNDMPGRLAFSTTADGASSPTERMTIYSTGQTIVAHNTSTVKVLRAEANSTSYASDVLQINCARSANTAYNLFKALSGNNADVEFKLAGNGVGYSDGGWTTPASDYAEFFEWVDGNPNNEDRRGMSVVLEGTKIREAIAGEEPLGIISSRPSIVGDAATDHWKEKHLTDEFGSYIMEPHNIVTWKDEDGKEHSYEDWNMPADVVVPDNAVVAAADENGITFEHRKLNPDYDPSQAYISRADRSEWDTVGLLGKLRMRKGQVTSARWIKMRDVNDSVEEWLVR